MIVLDTHAWIWWNSESENLSRRAEEAIFSSEGIGISIMSCWETAMLVAKQRLKLRIDVQDWIELALKRPKVNLISISPESAVLSTRLPGVFHGDPADRLIAASCLHLGFALVTADNKIREWGYIETIW